MPDPLRNTSSPAAAGLALALRSQNSMRSKLARMVVEYDKAWVSKNTDHIAALHSEDSIFVLNINGVKPVIGRAAIKAQFEHILSSNPAYHSTMKSIDFGENFVVIEYTFKIHHTPPMNSGKHDSNRVGLTFDVPAVDIIHFQDGLITIKHTYMDTGFFSDQRKVEKSSEPTE
jgi:hypothetical protein